MTQAPAGASPPSWVRQKLTPASAKAPPSRPSRAPLPPSPRKMTNHVAGAARANEEERERAKGRAFSTEEDVTLRKARWQPGWTWKEITSQLPGRSERATRDRWTRLQQQDARVGGEGSAPPGSYPPALVFWSAQEDATLRKARAEPGWSWKGITSQLPGRSKEAARERWRLLRQQDAQVGEGGSAPPGQMVWSAQEDDTLSKALGQPGWTWMGIASQLPGRSEKAARERWIRLRDQQAARDREEVGMHKRTLLSSMRVSSPGAHGRALRRSSCRSSQADQRKRQRSDGNDSSGCNRVRLLERKSGKLRKEVALRKGGKLRNGAALRKGGKLRQGAALRKGAAPSNSQFGVPGRTIRSARGLKSLDADGMRWRRDSRVGQKKGYGLDGQANSSRRPRLGKERAAAVAAPSSRPRALMALVARRQARTNGSGPH